MLKKNKKLLITIALLLITVVGVAYGAYAIADLGNEDKIVQNDVQNLGASLDGNLGYMEYVSNIDLIIQDSYTDGYMFNIVHIVPGSMAGQTSSVGTYVTNGSFKSLVIDAHSENTTDYPNGMASDKVKVYTLPLTSAITAESKASTYVTGANADEGYSIASLLGDADLIYIESPAADSYTGSNAMDDSIYSYLHNVYTGTDHKPIIVDKISGNSSGSAEEVKKTTYKTLINQISDRYLYSPVFGWEKSDDADSTTNFLQGKGSSHYFSKVLSKEATGKILVLNNTGTASATGDWIYDKFVAGNKSLIYYGKDSHLPGYAEWQAKADGVRESYDAYLTNPEYFDVTYQNVNDLVDSNKLLGYEFIIIENSAMSVEIDETKLSVFTELVSMANGTQYIIYDSANVEAKTDDDGGNGNRYADLLSDWLTAEGTTDKDYILPVDNGFFVTDALKETGAEKIAAILNGGNYRGSETNGRNGKKFRVLEIQPCYPIDTELAESKANMSDSALADQGVKGNYYTVPQDVMMNTSVDEANGAEYYAFEVTPAKIAVATGLKYNQIQVDQMSTDEFISSKEVVLDTYDLVYIGGNTSALTSHLYRSDYAGNFTSIKAINAYIQSKFVTAFDMYTHTGIATHLQSYESNSNTGVGGNPYGTISNSENIATSILMNGNDITTLKLQELKDYIDAGMPIVFSDKVSQAFEKVYDKVRLEKMSAKDIDPDSNMFKLLDYAMWKQNPSGYEGVESTLGVNVDKTVNAAKNIYWSMDISNYANSDEYNRNTNKMYGVDAGDYVTVFNRPAAETIKTTIQSASTRPSLIVTSAPEDYRKGDATTYNKKVNNTMTISANVVANADDGNPDAETGLVTCKLVLYVDQDGDGTFDEDEIADGGANAMKTVLCSETDGGKSSTVDLVYEFPQDDFFGLVSWKLVASVYDPDTKIAQPCDVKTGYAYYIREDEVEKKDVRVLQVMPVKTATSIGFGTGEQDSHTLYMCTECQLAKYKAEYNILHQGGAGFHQNTSGTQSKYGNLKTIGLHEHKFGIVEYEPNGPKRDNADVDTGSDNWDANLADSLMNDYSFDLDILLVDEFNAYTKVIAANTTADGSLVTMDNANGIERKDEDGEDIKVITDSDGNAITWVDYYQAMADKYYDKWEAAEAKLAKDSCIDTMVAQLEALKTQATKSGGLTSNSGYLAKITADQIQQWIDHEAYYNYFFYYSGYWPQADNATGRDYEYVQAYYQWVTLHDETVTNRNLYKKYSCYANTNDTWLGANYDMLVLGFADDFGGRDIDVAACNAIKSYVAEGGSVLTTHDSTTRYDSAGSVNLTTELRDVFGIDRFHATLDTEASTLVTVTDRTLMNVFLKEPSNSTYYGPVMLTNKHVTIKLVKSSALSADYLDYTEGSMKVYKPYEIVYGDTVNAGENFNISFELYDTIADAEAGNISTSSWGYGSNRYFTVNRSATQEIAFIDNFTGIVNGQGTYSSGSFKLNPTTVTTLRRPVYKFADSRYFITDKAVNGSGAIEDNIVWQYAVTNYANIANGNSQLFGITSLLGTTDSVGIFETKSHLNSPYLYAEFNLQSSIKYSIATDTLNKYVGGTDRAAQVNKGIVTTYPFTLDEELKISPTHPQTYATDLEDSNMAVWYTLAGSDFSEGIDAKSRSSLFAASPYDGMDNYFLYSYKYGKGTVHYCGAGHSVVTGAGRDNNDERRLYINLVVDSVRNSGSKPKITVLDKDNNELTEDSKGSLKLDKDGNPVYDVQSITDIPEFNFDVKFSSLTTLTDVYVFYDLNYDGIGADYSNKYTDDENHVLINHYQTPVTDASIGVKVEDSKMNAEVHKETFYNDANSDGAYTNGEWDYLKLNAKPKGTTTVDYFKNYGTYTYIVIWAKDANGKTAHKRIKINLIQTLFDLTQIDYPSSQYISMNKSMDYIDRRKFRI